MSERDHFLHGADDVRSASNTMARAADTMSSAASTMSEALHRHAMHQDEQRAFMDQWLQHFEAIVEKMNR